MSEAKTPPIDQDPSTGKFMPGNKANRKGNPTKRFALLQRAYMKFMTPDVAAELGERAIRMALAGDKVLLRYYATRLTPPPPPPDMTKDLSDMRDEMRELRELVTDLIKGRAS